MASLGGIKTQQMRWGANMTELNHLGAALALKPQLFESKVNEIFSSKIYSNNTLFSKLQGSEKIITSNEWEWKLKGATTRPAVVIEDVDFNPTPGRGKTTIKIKLDNNDFTVTDVITPGTSGQKFQCRIQEEPVRHGNGWVYTLRLVSDDFQAFVPKSFFSPGTQWAKLYSTAEEGATQDGSTQFSGTFSMKDRLGKFRKKYMITDYAAEEVLAIRIPDSKGTYHDSWVRLSEVEYWKQWYCELERAIWYNRSARSIEGSTGRPVDTFSGIQEKLEGSHIEYYNELTAKLIEEYLMNVYSQRVAPGAGRKVKVFTGEYGMLIFNRAMQDIMAKRGWIIANQNFDPVQKTKSDYHSNAYSIGYQFVTYKMQNGAELELVHNPQYDDPTINFEIDPITGYPTESMRFTFLDFANDMGGSNIQLVTKKDGYKFGYVAGLVSPFGPANNSLMSHSGEYYSMHVSKEIGVHIEDITRCGELILRRNVQ